MTPIIITPGPGVIIISVEMKIKQRRDEVNLKYNDWV